MVFSQWRGVAQRTSAAAAHEELGAWSLAAGFARQQRLMRAMGSWKEVAAAPARPQASGY